MCAHTEFAEKYPQKRDPIFLKEKKPHGNSECLKKVARAYFSSTRQYQLRKAAAVQSGIASSKTLISDPLSAVRFE